MNSTATKQTVLKKYGEATIIFSNLWEIESVMTPEELVIARQIREENTAKVIRYCRS